MSEKMMDWRRRWSPDLSALPWVPFTIDNVNLLMKSHFSQGSYTVLVYDYTSVWMENVEPDNVKATAKECNPNVEAPLTKLLQHLSDLLQEEQKAAKYSLRYINKAPSSGTGAHSGSLVIRLSSKLAQGVPFSWKLSLRRADDEVASTHLTIPLLTLLSELMRREAELQRLMKKKDEEIEDYKMSGAKVSRKNKLTQEFDGKAFNQEMLNSWGFRSEVEASGQGAFGHCGRELYTEVMLTRAWLNRPPAQSDDSDNDDDTSADGDVSATNRVQTAPSWVTRVPGSLCADIPAVADTSPVKSSPSKSPMKASPGPSAQETELMRRQALEKRLAEEKAKLPSKKKKKKLF